ncbi:RDD family protein [Flavobacterium aquicola]|uniref:RDD family protein n=1 Tax=Flavobacterium aquicola TaxID=1682742 RepID=A0A3E0DV53_9FLAO|nr:RDD family protein [Flavobacterium aquicola]REG88385.1 RDD family protein [Flavobacterium aquicola]
MSNKIKLISLSRRLRFINFIIDFIGIYFLWGNICYFTFFCFEKIFGFDFQNAQRGKAEVFPNGEINYEDYVNGIIFHIILASTFLISILTYYSILEFYFQKTLGKIVTRSKVVAENGEKATFRKIILRTICRFIPIDWVSFIFSRNGMHDKLSKTKVISD